MAGEPHRSIALAVTGASGALYAVRTLAELLSRGVHVELVVSDYGRRLLRDERHVGHQLPLRIARHRGHAVRGQRVRRTRVTSRPRERERQNQSGARGHGP